MFRFPHLGTPQSKIRVPHNESQMIHPTQQLSGSALSLQIARYTKVQLCQREESLRQKNVGKPPSPHARCPLVSQTRPLRKT
jgi:hypothetical protein